MSRSKVYTISADTYRLAGSEPLGFELVEVPLLSVAQRVILAAVFPHVPNFDGIDAECASKTRYVMCQEIERMKVDIQRVMLDAAWEMAAVEFRYHV
jgi:hypothetical protein